MDPRSLNLHLNLTTKLSNKADVRVLKEAVYGITPRQSLIKSIYYGEYKLRENENKGTWKDTPILELMDLLKEEVKELEHAILHETSLEVVMEAADVLNYASMIIDKLTIPITKARGK